VKIIDSKISWSILLNWKIKGKKLKYLGFLKFSDIGTNRKILYQVSQNSQ